VGTSGECLNLEDGPIGRLVEVGETSERYNLEDLEGSLEEVLESFLLTLYNWSMAFLYPISISYADFIVRFSLSS